MNSLILNQIFEDYSLASEIEINEIKQLTVEYPYYALPYIVLSKIYFKKEHYKFDSLLHHAAIRVQDREWLYHYIRAENTPAIIESLKLEVQSLPSFNQSQELIEVEVNSDNQVNALHDFLNEGPIDLEELIRQEIELKQDLLVEDLTILETTEVDNTSEKIVEQASELESPEKVVSLEIEEPIQIINEENEISKISENIQETIEINDDEVIDYSELNSLRKHPVYSVEEFLKDDTTNKNEAEVKDFFTWLKNPQHSHTINKEEVIVESEKDPIKENIIDRFIAVNPQISRPKKEFYNAEDMAKLSEAFDFDFVTETLANIYYEQGSTDMAIKAYEKLSLQNPMKKAYFASLIQKIKKEK